MTVRSCACALFASLAAACAGVVLLFGGARAPAAEPAGSSASAGDRVDFVRDVRTILADRCYSCHGPTKHKSGLRLDTKAGAMAGGDNGAAIVAGKSGESHLIELVTSTDPDKRMPGKGDPLTAAQVAVLKKWIDQGANWPASADAIPVAGAKKHWAFVKPVRPALPEVKQKDWARNPIDSFVLARLEKEGLHPAPEADRATLLRRLSLDLIGLPPSPEEVDAFVADRSPDAYERQVDRLLASPHYGERWARPWLDAARYGDTHGYEKDPPRSMWPWRDWVIDALNRNMPFDQFTVEQLAGDLLPNPTQSQLVATGFERNSLLNDEGGTDPEEFRVAAIMDRVDTTATVWLGMTMACAQCHSHKFDPITHKEYYQFFAFFNNTEDGGRLADPVLPLLSPDQQKELDGIRKQIAELSVVERADPAAEATNTVETKAKLAKVRAAERAIVNKAPTTMIMRERKPPRETHLLLRGSYHSPGDVVTPGVPSALPPLPEGQPVNRLALARWLVSKENPLTARVTVNRYWGLLFGTPLVETPEDFGTQGEPPSHPELLDWLAVEFMDPSTRSARSGQALAAGSASSPQASSGQVPSSGWDVKALLKTIVMSATYRQASAIPPDMQDRDPHNRLLARGPRFRVEAEMVRDMALAMGGRLSPKVGGPSVFPPQPPGIWENSFGFQTFAGNQRWRDDDGADRWRRGLYIYWRRTAPYPSLQTFDLVSRDVCKVRRSRTNTPLQALTTLNDPAFVECAGGLAMKMSRHPAEGLEAKVAYGVRVCLSRKPKEREIEKLVALYRDALADFEKDEKGAAKLLRDGRVKLAEGEKPGELAAWTVVANALLNLDETITKN